MSITGAGSQHGSLQRQLWSAWASAVMTASGIATLVGIVLVTAVGLGVWSHLGLNIIGFAAHSIVWALGLGVAIAIGRGLLLIVERYKVHAKRLLLKEGLCPLCSYEIADMSAAVDNLIACPECGSRWRQGRIGDSADAVPRVVDWPAATTSDRPLEEANDVQHDAPPARQP